MAGDQDDRSHAKADEAISGERHLTPLSPESKSETSAAASQPVDETPVSSEASESLEAPSAIEASADEAHADAIHAEAESVGADKSAVEGGGAPTEPKAEGAGTVRQRSAIWPLAAAIVIGAILAVGGAFLLRFFDKSGTVAADLSGRIASLSERLESTEKKLDSTEKKIDALANAERAAVAGVESRIGAAESAASKTAAETAAALRDAQNNFAARLSALVKAPNGGADEIVDLGPLQTRIDSVEKKLETVENALAAPKADVRAQQDRENVATQLEQGAHAQAVAIVAESLLQKVDRGVAFPTEFAALENLGLGPAQLAALQPFAATGVVSTRKLAEQFSDVASQVAAAEESVEDKNLLERLKREASHLVRIRPVGDVDASDVDAPALVARIENALARLDIEEAVGVWAQLPASAKAKSQSWADAAKARIDAVNAARSLEADAVAALGKPKS
ncbi:COG4223 family protein [Methylocapsa acidiphila]|uniref:COG4223 family protein n=1 Tax=Methylocapsa acidiphila TaxID=133552 RepID=UPI00042619C1|nr:hypothetical protein [Methylocapsa acidiphila]